jgi:hypothetical protein
LLQSTTNQRVVGIALASVKPMASRRLWLWVPLGLGAALLTVALVAIVALVAFPDLVRAAVVARLHAMTQRPVVIEALTIDPWSGRIALRGLKITDTDGGTLATLDRLDARVRRGALLRGHIWLTRLAIDGSTVRVVRYSDGEFNISELIPKKPGGGGSALDLTVDEATLARGSVLLEDRSLSPWRTWRSDDLAFQARNISTRRDDGTAEASSTINGSPVSVRIDQLRLKPAHLRAVVRAQNVDMALARVYVPAEAPVTLEKGRLDLTVNVLNDAREGVHIDADATVADAVAVRRFERDPFIRAPALRVAVRDFTYSPRGLALGRVEVNGGASVQHGDARFDLARVRMRAEALTWPVQAPARVSLSSTVPGGGELTADGTVSLRPAAADLDVRLIGLSVEPWAKYVSGSARATGTGEARLAVHADLGGGVSATATGVAAVNRLSVTDGGRRLLAADRAEVSGIDAGWPARVTIGRVAVKRPAVSLERDEHGVIALPTPDRPAPRPPGEEDAMQSPPYSPMPPVTVREVIISDGAVDWRDAAVKPGARLEMRAIHLAVQDVVWPPRGATPLQLRVRAPGGGTLAVNGSVTATPIGADVRVRADGVELSPYRPYLPMAAGVGGRVDGDLQVAVSHTTELQARVRGDTTVRGAFIADGRRRIASVDRAEARGLDVEWPARVVAERVTLRRPWVVVERDEHGGFPLRALLTAPSGNGATVDAAAARTEPPARTIAVRRLVVEDGGARFVDRSTAAPYAEDMTRMWAQITGLATAPADPARIDVRGVLGGAGHLTVRGQVGALGGPLFLDVTTELRELPMPRLNPYMNSYTGWNARAGRLATTVKARVDGDELNVRTQTQLGRLQVVRAAPDDTVEKRMGLPLGMIVALLKDRQGNISLSLPVGGKLSDPKFDFHEAMWSALRTLTVKTIAAPVSWIGRLRLTPDSKIADIEVDPLGFPAGSSELTGAGAERVGAVAGFMKTLPDVRMILTPSISLGDVEALKAEQIRARIRDLAREQKLSERDAAARLYAEHYRREPPDDVEAAVTALREVEPPPAEEAYRLAKRRAYGVRDALKKAEVEPERLQINKEPDALDTLDGGRLEFSLTDRVKPRRSLADLLRALVQTLAQRLETLKR